MRIFLTGATGVIGIRLLSLMLAEGHVVAAMTRTPRKIDGLRAPGVTPRPVRPVRPELSHPSGQGLQTGARRSSSD